MATIKDSEAVGTSKPRLLGLLGPGLITGASDDDPSGIATYAQAGAQFGYGLNWSLVLTYPLMAAVQEISALVGRTTGHGIAGNLQRHYPYWVLQTGVALLLVANVFNLGADLGAMGDAVKLLIGGPRLVYVVGFGLLCGALQIFMQYARYVSILKWTTITLFAYFGTVLMVHVPWGEVAASLIVPTISFDTAFVTTFVALLGTTISPYLFFWQSSEEAEDERVIPRRQPLVKAPAQASAAIKRIRLDTLVGMAFSNLVALAIMITTAATLHVNHVTDIATSAQAAEALKPLAGQFAFAVFALGIIGTGLLAVPVLAGSAAYAIGEARRWPVGLGRRPSEAKAFYGTLAAATALGTAMNFMPIDPIRALFWSAVLNGVLAVPILVMIMQVASSPKVMGHFTIGATLKILGWLTTVIMGLAAIGMIVTSFM